MGSVRFAADCRYITYLYLFHAFVSWYQAAMGFEFDPAKSDENKRTQGSDFEEAQARGHSPIRAELTNLAQGAHFPG